MKVLACSNAFIVLSEEDAEVSENIYEVAIGIDDNKQSVIRESLNGGSNVSVDTPEVLSCYEYR